MTALVEVVAVRKSFPRANPRQPTGEVLCGISLDVQEGEFLAITGPSGSGKSTLLNLIGTLDRPSAGSITLLGKAIENLSGDDAAQLRNQALGFVFQSFHLLYKMTVWANATLPLIYAGVSRQERRKRVAGVLSRVGLAGYENHLAGELSGGQQQRVALARALINSPRLLLADEPTGNLDTRTGREMLEMLRELNGEGLTIVMVTHDPNCRQAASRAIQVIDGTIHTTE
jgi:putative ABC transport system ATP-binding protein